MHHFTGRQACRKASTCDAQASAWFVIESDCCLVQVQPQHLLLLRHVASAEIPPLPATCLLQICERGLKNVGRKLAPAAVTKLHCGPKLGAATRYPFA